MKRFLFSIFILLTTFYANAQLIEPIKWSFDSKQKGQEAELIFTATIDKGWHLYDTYLPEGGPIPTSIVFEDSTGFELVGELQKNPEPETHFDKTFQLNLSYFVLQAVLIRKIRLLTTGPVELKGYVEFMGCNDETCLPPNEAQFSFSFNQGKAAEVLSAEKKDTVQGIVVPIDSLQTGVTESQVKDGELEAVAVSRGQNLWIFILISLIAGLAAILTPCVFPMIPMTVSFFMRGSANRRKAIITALFFGLSILFIFTLLGALFSFGIFGPNVGSLLSTHWIPNLLFFILFLVFSISFFGAFEIVLPSGLVNKTDARADKGGMIGAFFMALTTVIVSFSCTGPFIGALIIEAVQGGGLRPLIGMFFFGFAFATPFTLLAIFPSALSKLPKSGSWLNSIKVVFAFILLAFGFKFLSNIDQVYGFNILNREIYLAIWISIFLLLGLYFLGKIKFSHDSDLPYLGVGRLFMSLLTFIFVLYLFTGLLGAPLTTISSLIPPATVKPQSGFQPAGSSSLSASELCGPAKYADKLHLPQGIKGYFDFEQGIECAREQGKPAFIVFKGHACANCKKMEGTVWADPEVLKLLTEKFVVIGLYTDDRTTLPEQEWGTSSDGRILKTMGKKNLDLQISKYNTNSIPYHVIIKPEGKTETLGVTFNAGEFKSFIEKGL